MPKGGSAGSAASTKKEEAESVQHSFDTATESQDPPIREIGPLSASCPSSPLHPIEKDHEEASRHSENSLLASWHDDDESQGDSLATCDDRSIARIRQRFEMRSETLQRVTARVSSPCRQILIENERAARRHTLHRYRERTELASSPEKAHVSDVTPPATISVPSKLIFEMFHTPEAIWGMAWYCIGHAAFFGVIDWVIAFLQIVTAIPPVHFHLLLLVASFACMRANGFLWWFLGEDTYRMVKFDLHNRDQLGSWDAKIMRLIQQPRHKTFKWYLDMTLFYCGYIGVTYFYYAFQHAYDEAIWSWCTAQDSVTTSPDMTECGEVDVSTLLMPWYKRIVSYAFCSDTEQGGFTAALFHVLAFSVAAGALSVTGVDMLE
eukprot:Nitzschia sp. Nitz4//scaffold2_size372955//131813//132946//NITZ4_000399-RA/size372955-processed-gene-0.22-mRNA-1//1//CDS//3329546704//9069//frame0